MNPELGKVPHLKSVKAAIRGLAVQFAILSSLLMLVSLTFVSILYRDANLLCAELLLRTTGAYVSPQEKPYKNGLCDQYRPVNDEDED